MLVLGFSEEDLEGFSEEFSSSFFLGVRDRREPSGRGVVSERRGVSGSVSWRMWDFVSVTAREGTSMSWNSGWFSSPMTCLGSRREERT